MLIDGIENRVRWDGINIVTAPLYSSLFPSCYLHEIKGLAVNQKAQGLLCQVMALIVHPCLV